jgi:hypothetical protein
LRYRNNSIQQNFRVAEGKDTGELDRGLRSSRLSKRKRLIFNRSAQKFRRKSFTKQPTEKSEKNPVNILLDPRKNFFHTISGRFSNAFFGFCAAFFMCLEAISES